MKECAGCQGQSLDSLNKKLTHYQPNYTPKGYIVPAEFGVHFLLRLKNVPKGAKLHINEIGLTKNEFCKRQI